MASSNGMEAAARSDGSERLKNGGSGVSVGGVRAGDGVSMAWRASDVGRLSTTRINNGICLLLGFIGPISKQPAFCRQVRKQSISTHRFKDPSNPMVFPNNVLAARGTGSNVNVETYTVRRVDFASVRPKSVNVNRRISGIQWPA